MAGGHGDRIPYSPFSFQPFTQSTVSQRRTAKKEEAEAKVLVGSGMRNWLTGGKTHKTMWGRLNENDFPKLRKLIN